MKKRLHKIGVSITSSFILFFSYAANVFALNPQGTKTVVSGKISTEDSLQTTAIIVLKWILGVTFTFTVVMIVIGGFRYITSAGNEKQAEEAKEMLTKAIIGFIFIILSYIILVTIDQILNGIASTS
jgi:hypothetical protein